MATRSSAPLDDIEDQFNCSICLSALQEPKLLPECLHRLCKECLAGLITASRNSNCTEFKCPLCNREYKIPQNGVDGFRTDFFVKGVLGTIRHRKSLGTGTGAESRQCLGCGGADLNATFCPEINGYLCSPCFQTNKAAGGIVSQTESLYLAVDGEGDPRATVRESLPDSSRCHTHPEQIAQIRCETCGNVPICTMCTFTAHTRHVFVELRTLSCPSRIPQTSERFDITEEGVINIAGIQETTWEINSFTSIRGDQIVLTGKAADTSAHVSTIDVRGDILRKNKLRKLQVSVWLPLCHCEFFSEDITAIASQDGQVGVYNVRDGTLQKINIRQIFHTWPENRFLTCIATDSASGNIFVGTKTRGGTSTELLVFDEKLNYRRTIMLPRIVGYTRDLSVCGDRLLVCDVKGKNVIAVTIHGLEAKLKCRFPNPELDGGDWSPFRVCTDSKGFIYVLWEAQLLGLLRKTLTQYCQDGSRLLKTMSVDADAADVLTKLTEDGEKLLIVTRSSAKIHVFGFSAASSVIV